MTAQALEPASGVPEDDLFRIVDSLHGSFKSAPVHTFRLSNVVADASHATNFLAYGEGAGQRAILRRSR
jgi:hypothetical protein